MRAGVLAGGLVVLGGLVALLVSRAGPAWAHAAIVSSQPEAGSDLAAAPPVVRLRFSEPLIADLSTATVIDPTGQVFASGPTGEREITVDLSTTAQGPYVVEWKTVSPLDGHTLRGRCRFGVGSRTGAPAGPAGLPIPADLVIAAARILEYAGLLGVLGLLSLAALAGGAGLGWAPRGLHLWVGLAATGGLATVAGELALASSGSLATSVRAFVLAPSGLPRVGRLGGELAAVAVVWRAVRAGPGGVVEGRGLRAATGLLAVGSLGLLAASGHAAAAGGYGILAGAGHLWAAGVWAGSLLVMATQRPPGGWRGKLGRRLLAEFGPIALATFAATVVLGSVRGVQELAAFSDLWAESYGQVLSLKVGLVALIVPFSLLAWRRHRAHPRAEGLLAVGAVVAAAVLAAFPVPPGRIGQEASTQQDARDQGLPRPGDLTLAATAGRTVVGLTLHPTTPGINDLFVYLIPPGGESQAPPLKVEMAVDDGQPTTLGRCCPACRKATAPLQGGERLNFQVSGKEGGSTSVVVPALPAEDGTALVDQATTRMKQLNTYRYEEVFGPVEPPFLSRWEVAAPDRLHGVATQGQEVYREIIRIADRRWMRQAPDAAWEGGEPGGPTVQSNRFIWDYPGRTAARIIDTDTVEDTPTRVASFFVLVGDDLPIWYTLWIDGDRQVRRAEMRAQDHFMERHYRDVNAPVTIQPPPGAPHPAKEGI